MSVTISGNGSIANINQGELPVGSSIQIRRGSSSETAAFTGAAGELTYNTDTKSIVAHDGITPGGSDITKKLAASSGASLVGYMPGGVGAVGTDVETTLRKFVFAEQFPSLQAAFDYWRTYAGPIKMVATGRFTITSPLECIFTANDRYQRRLIFLVLI